MSLEQQVAALVDAANNLTSTVNGKMGQIDQRVDEAIAGVSQEILKNMGRTWVLDQQNGSDDNNGTSLDDAVASFRHIADSTPAGGAVAVRVFGEYTFNNAAGHPQAGFHGSQVYIRSFDTTQPTKIKFEGYIYEERYHVRGFSAYRNTLFNFVGINLELPDVPVGSAVAGFQAACISTHAGGDVPTPLSIRLTDVEFFVPDATTNPYRFTTGTGMVMMSTNNVTAPQAWVDNWGLFTNPPAIDQRVSAKFYHDGSHLIPA